MTGYEVIWDGDISRPDRGILGMAVHPIVQPERSPFARDQRSEMREKAKAKDALVLALLDPIRPQTGGALAKQLPWIRRNTVHDVLRRLVLRGVVIRETPTLGGRVGPPLYRRG